ncbi:hypothetical protein LJC62_02685 [Odoribacter sp. OttesenSCG-928-A06]|nr:hypothetical protein [Odoribacter sp. OttesenSCG-928-A06]
MSLITEVLKYPSVSIIGMEKNTGKTESLNYILRGVRCAERTVAVTSIGIDGESCDQVTGTEKPEIELFDGMWFVTSEKHYREKQLTAVIEEIGEQETALGRLVTAKALGDGKILLSGPSDTAGIKTEIASLRKRGVDTVIVDGALSRKSFGAPTVTDAMILATGAAVSANIPNLVYRTKYIYDLIMLEEVQNSVAGQLTTVKTGIWAEDERGEWHDLEIASGLSFSESKTADLFRYGCRFFVSGAVGDKFIDFLRRQKFPVELIVRDFTRIFASPELFYSYIKSGKTIRVLERSRLLAICVNPQSPEGFVLDSATLCNALQKEVDVPVIDVKKRDAV